MGYNYKEANINNVEFKNILQPQIKTGGFKIARGAYAIGGDGKIEKPQPFVNAIDIDWNNAEITGLEDPITSSAQLLGILGDLYNKVNTGDGLGDGYKHVIIDAEEYAELEEYDPKTIYFIIGDMGEDEPSGEDTQDFNTDLYVNETHYTTDGQTISLTPGNEYIISGTLKGKILIDASQLTDTQLKDLEYTKITLNGVKIESDDAYGIMYKIPTSDDPTVQYKGYKGISVTLKKNTFNSIKCTLEAEGEDQPGAIYSMNNIELQGPGYLALQNSAGHGIRGQEVKLFNPHIWMHASHDGVHGKNITIVGGTYYLDSCNDGFGSSSKGRILYFDGEIRTKNASSVKATLLDSKNYGVYFNESLLSENDLTNCIGMHLISKEAFNVIVGNTDESGELLEGGMINGKVYGYPTKNDYENDSNSVEINISQIPQDSSYSTSTAERGYEITYPYVLVTGYIDAPLHFSDTYFSSDNDAQVYLYNAYIKTSYNYNSIYYDSKSGRLKIKAENDTLNIIENTYYNDTFDREFAQSYDSDAIKSENNITIEANNNSILYITSKGSDGIDGGEIKITDSKGTIAIANCGMRGIKGNAVVIGPTAVVTDSIITSYITDPNAVDSQNPNKKIYTTFDGVCYVKNNCNYFNVGEPQGNKDDDIRKNTGFADIYCRNGKATKGVFGTTNNELVGHLFIGIIGYAISANFGNAEHLYYNTNISANTNKTLTGDPGASNETYFAKTITNTNI